MLRRSDIAGGALTLLLLCGGAAAQEREPVGASPSAPEVDSSRNIGREETAVERRDREESMSTFDETGRLRSQPDQLRSQSGLTTDRLRRSQNPSYGVGPGVNIIRREP